MSTQVKSLFAYVRDVNEHYEELSNDPAHIEGPTAVKAFYAEELYDDTTVVDLQTNKDDVERAISIATGALRNYDEPYMSGEKEPTDESIRTRSLMLRSLNRLFMMRSMLSNMEPTE